MKNKCHIASLRSTNLFSVALKSVMNLPCHVFLKNLEGTYLAYNDYGASNLGYNCGKEISGKNDFDLFPSDIAEQYQKNDQIVDLHQKQFFFPEKGYD